MQVIVTPSVFNVAAGPLPNIVVGGSGIQGIVAGGNVLSGYVFITGAGVNTAYVQSGILFISGASSSGTFYPLGSNPSGYITTGQTGAFGGSANTGQLTGTFYPLTGNPSGYIIPNQTGQFASTGNVIFATGVQTIFGNKTLNMTTTGVFTINIPDSSQFVLDVILQAGESIPSSGSGGYFMLSDFSSINAIDVANRQAFNISGITTFDWSNKILSGLWYSNGLFVNGNPVVTGGPYYPLSNPSGYISSNQTGNFLTSGHVIYGSSLDLSIKTVTGNYTLALNDYSVLFSGNNLTGTLPSAIGNSGLIFNIKDVSGNLTLTGSQNIDNSSLFTAFTTNKGIAVQSDGNQWWVINHSPTGTLTGQFYPLLNNPSGYITTGNIIAGTDISISGSGSYIFVNYTGPQILYGNGNPNGVTTGSLGWIYTDTGAHQIWLKCSGINTATGWF